MKNLSIAYAIRRKNMKLKGQSVSRNAPEEASDDPKSIVEAIRMKKMAKGGLVKEEEDFLPELEDAPEEDDFLLPSAWEVEPKPADRKAMISKVVSKIRNSQTANT